MTKHRRQRFGYKNQINVDVKHKLIHKYTVTDAATHDSRVIDELLDERNTRKDVYDDSAYRSAAISERLREQGYRDRIHRKGYQGRPLDGHARAANKSKSRIRARVEHVFGRQAQSLGGTLLRCIGMTRAKALVGLRTLVYNFDLYARLVAAT